MGDGPLFSFLILSSYFLLPTFFFLLSSLRLRAFAPLRFFLPAFFLPAFFLPAFFLLRSRVRSNNRRLELLVYNQTLAFSVLGLCCPRTLYPSTSSFLCDS